MTTDIQYETPTWNHIYDMLLNQAQKIRKKGYNFDFAIGIARGGLISTRILCDLLEIPEFTIIQIEYYIGIAETKIQPIIKQGLSIPIRDKKILLIDDISDSGKSLTVALNHLKTHNPKEIKTATLYFKPGTLMVPDFFENQTNSWVVFPWEIKETLDKIIHEKQGKRTQKQEIGQLVKAGLPRQLVDKLLSDTQME